MLTIFGEHGLVPVPVDIDPDTLEPEPGAINAEVERCNARRSDNGDGNGGNDCGRVRAIYIAHVFGAQARMLQSSDKQRFSAASSYFYLRSLPPVR